MRITQISHDILAWFCTNHSPQNSRVAEHANTRRDDVLIFPLLFLHEHDMPRTIRVLLANIRVGTGALLRFALFSNATVPSLQAFT
jgi:hypothetical protein